jgi:hypothetical protein
MSFRRTRDDWHEFLNRHGSELRECGVPDYIVRDRMRFLGVLEHDGHDDWGRAETHPSSAWSIGFLTSAQSRRLADFIVRHFGAEKYPWLIRNLRRQGEAG